MFEYIQFYTKNLSNFTVLLLLGFIIAILDITIRKVVKGVYLNVRENKKLKHGGGGKEGLETKSDDKKKTDDKKKADNKGDEAADDTGESCPKDCNAVETLRKRLTVLIEDATKLQKEVKENNDIIKTQQFIIENLKKGVQKIVEASNKKK